MGKSNVFTAGTTPLAGLHIDPTPGFGVMNVAKTQLYNLTGHKAPGYNAPGNKGDTYIDPNAESFRSGGKIYNAGGSVIGTYKTGNDTGNDKGTVYTGHVQGDSTGPTAQELAAYGTYKSQANSALGKLLNAYNTQKQALGDKYDTQSNELQSGYNHYKQNYDQSVTQQQQDQLRQNNQIAAGTHNAYQNLMNMLGAYGGGASSVALQWAPDAAQQFQNAQLGAADQNTAENLRNLNTTWGNYLNDFDKQKKQMADSRKQDLANAQGAYQDTSNRLHDILRQINDQALPAATIGSSLENVTASIPNLKYVKPTYNGIEPTYTAPSLSSFETMAPQANFSADIPAGNTAANPSVYLLAQQQRRQNTPALAYLLDQQRNQANVTPVA